MVSKLVKKLAFLNLDAGQHQTYHIAPIAFASSQQCETWDCYLLTTQASLPLVEAIASAYPDHRCQIQVLSPGWGKRLFNQLRRKPISGCYLAMRHADLLRTFDAVITPDTHLDQWIQKTPAAVRPMTIFTFHGAGDRAFSVRDRLRYYDYLLLPGNSRQQRLAQKGLLQPDHWQITGYPKFDLCASQPKATLFTTDKPIIWYNPHFAHDLSSWPQWGLKILDYFYRQTNYQLIFAPHANLFKQRDPRRYIPAAYFEAEHLIIDVGSAKTMDMTYSNAVDLYLGDVSSQVYEFLYRPRPCVFLNPRQLVWPMDESFVHWHLGPVVEDLTLLASTLASSLAANAYRSQQIARFNQIFTLTAEPSAVRAAKAIQRFIS